jgi:cytochrome P450
MVASIPAGHRSRVLTSYRLLRDPFAFWADARARYGDTFEARAWNGDVVCTGDPAMIAEIFKADTEQVKPFRADAFGPLLGRHSVLMLWGSAHKEQRRLLSPPFAGPRTRALGAVFRDTAAAHVARWPDGGEIRAADELLSISLELIVRAVFGVLDAAEVERWVRDVREMVAAIDPLFLFFPVLQRLPGGRWRRFVERRDRLDAALRARIRAGRTSGARGDDVLSMLLDATHEDGSPMAEDEIPRRARDAPVRRARDDADRDGVAPVPPGPEPRRDGEGAGGARGRLPGGPAPRAVPGRGVVRGPAVDAHRARHAPDDHHGPSRSAATRCRRAPTCVSWRRWCTCGRTCTRSPSGSARSGSSSASSARASTLPFGGGVRRCLGAGFATVEGKLVVGTILRAFDVESLQPEEPVRRNATMGVRHGVRLRLRRRAAA